MRTVRSQKDVDTIERERALVGVFLDRAYSREKIEWLLDAQTGFDCHARDAWHLLIPIEAGYGVDTMVTPEEYGKKLAGKFIDRLEIKYPALPCIVFRASEENYFFLKLGGKRRDEFLEEIGRVADLAKECQEQGPSDPEEFRSYVNMHVAIHLRRRRLLSAAASAIPALNALLGNIVDIKELV